MGDYFEREPIFWTSTRPGYNDKDRTRVRFENGRKIVEKVPQRGHQGDYENRRPARGIRSVRVVRHDGHMGDSVLTNAAAHLDHTTPFGQYIQAKWRYFGWYPIGTCPLARLASGEMLPDHFANQELLNDRPCPPGACSETRRIGPGPDGETAVLSPGPCGHAIAEMKARQAVRKTEAAEVEKRFTDRDQKMIDAQRENTLELAQAIIAAIRAGREDAPNDIRAAQPADLHAAVAALARSGHSVQELRGALHDIMLGLPEEQAADEPTKPPKGKPR